MIMPNLYSLIWLNPSNKSIKLTITHVTPFAEKAKPVPRYGGLVQPFCDQILLELSLIIKDAIHNTRTMNYYTFSI